MMRWLRAVVMGLGTSGRMVVVASAMGLPVMAAAQVTTTTIADTVYHADGTLASGLVIVSWPTFTTGAGQAVPSGSTSATIGSDGKLTMQLAPNVGATPAGTSYTAVFHLDDGSVSRQSWAVPVSATAVTLAAVQTSVLPAGVAVQTASKSYVDSAIAAALAGQPVTGTITFLNRTGDTMLGPLVLAGDPVTGSQAANKHYVDTSIAGVNSAAAGRLSMTPAANQVISQPLGTQMEVNRLNSNSYASQFVTGVGNNGLANAIADPGCTSGCQVTVEQSYASKEPVLPLSWNSTPTSGTHVRDLRGGGTHDVYLNPVNLSDLGFDAGQVIDVSSTKSPQTVLQATGNGLPSSSVLALYHEGLAGGSNLYPASIEGSSVPYFKSNFNALSVNGVYNTMGQHVLSPNTVKCYGVGDCLIGAQFMTASGGFRDEADEGTHPMDLQIREDTAVFVGTCSSGCSTGSTAVTVAATAAGGTQGDGRFLVDMAPAQTITAGVLTGGGGTGPDLVGPTATFRGSNFPASVFLRTAQIAKSQAQNTAPGTVVLPIGTSGLPAVFATSTASLPATSGVACVTDAVNGYNPHNYEMVPYTVVDATHLQLTLNKAHAANATVAVGGLCGYGLEQTVDTVNGIRQLFPVIGSTSATQLYYAGGLTPIVGVMGSTSGYVNVSLPISGMTRASGVVTVTTGAGVPKDVSGLTMTVAGAADTSYNGNFVVSVTGPTTLTFSSAGADGTTTSGTIAVVTGGYALRPMAEVLQVYNPVTQKVDGAMQLAPNLVAWNAGDPVEMPHYFQENVTGDVEFVGQQTPRPTTLARAGMQYETNVGPGLRGWSILNRMPVTSYLGNGGTHSAPDEALDIEGVWNYVMETQAGETSAFKLHCNSHGCGRWNSGYNLFELDSNGGEDYVKYLPQSSAMGVQMGGTQFWFTPQGLSANALTATTVNATTVNATAVAAGGVTTNGNSRFAGGPTIFGSGVPLLHDATQEAYVQALSVAGNNAGVFVSRGATGNYASLDLVTGPTGNTGWSLQMQPNSTDAVLADRANGQNAMVCRSGNGCSFPEGLSASNFNGILSGTTGAIGGGALAAGACVNGTVSVPGATVGVPVAVSANDGSLPSGVTMLSAAVSSAGTVTVQVCAVAATTPAAKSYNVRVLQ